MSPGDFPVLSPILSYYRQDDKGPDSTVGPGAFAKVRAGHVSCVGPGAVPRVRAGHVSSVSPGAVPRVRAGQASSVSPGAVSRVRAGHVSCAELYRRDDKESGSSVGPGAVPRVRAVHASSAAAPSSWRLAHNIAGKEKNKTRLGEACAFKDRGDLGDEQLH